MKKLIVEFIGTFFLVLTVCAFGGHPLGGIAIGSALMVMVYAGGHISGGHYNPAVTLGVWLRGKCEAKDVVPYWIIQVIAAVVAVLVAFLLAAKSGNPFAGFGEAAGDNFKVVPVILAELIGTFALVWVVLNTATSKSTAGNSYYGLAIGFAVATCAIALAGAGAAAGSKLGYTCGAFNPAVAVGALLSGGIKVSTFLVVILSDLVGGVVAAFAYRTVNGNE